MSEFNNRRKGFLQHIPIEFPTRQEWFEQAYKEQTMIRKKDLISFEIYCGHCRNSSIAIWEGFNQEFIYFRTEFGSEFMERIDHPEDEFGNTDVFIPHIKFKDIKDKKYKDNFLFQHYVIHELQTSFFFLEKEYEKLRILEQRIKKGEKL